MIQLTFQEAVRKLSRVGIKEHEIYLIDIIILCEMAWADGTVQEGEREILFMYLNHHIDSINRLAGCRVLEHKQAKDLIRSFLDTRPSRELIETIEEVIAPIRINQLTLAEVENACINILNACLDIASSSVTQYPYGPAERFTNEEKEYYHKIATILTRQMSAFTFANQETGQHIQQ